VLPVLHRVGQKLSQRAKRFFTWNSCKIHRFPIFFYPTRVLNCRYNIIVLYKGCGKKSIPRRFFTVFFSNRLEFQSDILAIHLVILYTHRTVWSAYSYLTGFLSYEHLTYFRIFKHLRAKPKPDNRTKNWHWLVRVRRNLGFKTPTAQRRHRN